MKKKTKEAQDRGEIDATHNKLLNDTKAYARRPRGIVLPRSKAYFVKPYDPTFTLKHDVKDGTGKILFMSGTTFNPLDFKNFSKTLCFIDGDDLAQVAWLGKYCSDDLKVKRILVNGDVDYVTRKLKKKMYFDQSAELVKKFDIKAVPTVIRQSGRVLYVEEFPAE